MSESKIDALTKEPDFTVRANKFLREINDLKPDFPEMVITGRNCTLSDLKNPPLDTSDMGGVVDLENEIESATKNVVRIGYFSDSPRDIAEFELEADEIAENLGGKKTEDTACDDQNEPGEKTFKFEGVLHYEFE